MATTNGKLPNNDFSTSEIQLGKYEHYKGNLYEVVGVVMHTETNEKLVIYRALYELDKNSQASKVNFFARPYEMFFEKISVNGKIVDRFKYVGAENTQKGNKRFKVA